MARSLFVPRNNAVIEKHPGLMTGLWQTLMDNLVSGAEASSSVEGSEALTEQSAAIVTTPIGAPAEGGRYRVSYQMVVTRAAGTSSSATLTLSWVFGGVTFSQAFAAMTGNALTTQQTGSLPLINVDADTEITYAVAYASVGSPTMQFSLDLSVELLPS